MALRERISRWLGRRPVQVFPPGDFIKEELKARGWLQKDLARLMGRDVSMISLLTNGRRPVTAKLARELGAVFGTPPEYWMNLETAWQLWLEEVKEPKGD